MNLDRIRLCFRGVRSSLLETIYLHLGSLSRITNVGLSLELDFGFAEFCFSRSSHMDAKLINLFDYICRNIKKSIIMNKSSSTTLRVFLAVLLVFWVLALIGGTAYLFYNGHKLFGVAVLGLCLVLVPAVILGAKVVIGSYIVESCKKIDDARKVEDLTDIINAAEKNGAIKNVVVYRDKLRKIVNVHVYYCRN